jgi:DNA-binding MarR family transcriptional regulator
MSISNVSHLHTAMRFCRLRHSQIRASQLELLLAVQLKPGQTQSELAIACDMSLSAVSKAVDVMGTSGRKDKLSGARLGWLEIKRNPDDDRVALVYLTKAGTEFVSLLEAITYGSSIPV